MDVIFVDCGDLIIAAGDQLPDLHMTQAYGDMGEVPIRTKNGFEFTYVLLVESTGVDGFDPGKLHTYSAKLLSHVQQATLGTTHV